MAPSMQTANTRHYPMWAHVLIMLVTAPLLWGLIFGVLNGFSVPASAAHAVLKFAEWLGSVLIALVIGWLTLLFRRPNLSWSLLLGLIAVFAYGVHYTERKFVSQRPPAHQAPTDKALSASASHQKKTLIVTSVDQSSYGATAEDIDPDFVSMLEGHFTEESQKQYQAAMKSMGYPGESIDYEVGTVLFNESGAKLAVTTLTPRGRNGAITKVAWWIVGGELKRVVCVDTEGNAIPIRFGPCASKISEVFGYKNWPLESKLP